MGSFCFGTSAVQRMLQESLLFLSLASVGQSKPTKTVKQVLPYVPVVFDGMDIMEYWNSNTSVPGDKKFALNITSTDENRINRTYQMFFSSLDNRETFQQDPNHYLPQYGGF